MSGRPGRLKALYGAGPLHLLMVLACLALTAYTISVLGLRALWDPHVWWQSILVWFLGAVFLHDLVLFPAYALADRFLHGRLRRDRTVRRARVSPLNYVRVPVLADALIFLIFFPGIIEQGAGSYHRATGQTQAPFLTRWLLITGVIFALSAIAYGVQVVRADRRGA